MDEVPPPYFFTRGGVSPRQYLESVLAEQFPGRTVCVAVDIPRGCYPRHVALTPLPPPSPFGVASAPWSCRTLARQRLRRSTRAFTASSGSLSTPWAVSRHDPFFFLGAGCGGLPCSLPLPLMDLTPTLVGATWRQTFEHTRAEVADASGRDSATVSDEEVFDTVRRVRGGAACAVVRGCMSEVLGTRWSQPWRWRRLSPTRRSCDRWRILTAWWRST